MINDEVTIYNLALNAVGARSTVSIPTERSREAETCRLWFGPVRDQVLRAAPWPSAKGLARLALAKERDNDLDWNDLDPEPGYQYAYRAPSDMLAPRYISNYARFSLAAYPDNTMVISTSQPNPILIYTKAQPIMSLWDVSLQMAIVYGLAGYITMPLTGKSARAGQNIKQANDLIWQARENAANTDDQTFESIPEWIAARGYTSIAPQTRFIFPQGDLLSIGGANVS